MRMKKTVEQTGSVAPAGSRLYRGLLIRWRFMPPSPPDLADFQSAIQPTLSRRYKVASAPPPIRPIPGKPSSTPAQSDFDPALFRAYPTQSDLIRLMGKSFFVKSDDQCGIRGSLGWTESWRNRIIRKKQRRQIPMILSGHDSALFVRPASCKPSKFALGRCESMHGRFNEAGRPSG